MLGEQEKELKQKLERYEEDRKILCQQKSELEQQMRDFDEKPKAVRQREMWHKQLAREQAVINRESSVLKRESAVAIREMEVGQRESMVIADRERLIADRERMIAEEQERASNILCFTNRGTRPQHLNHRTSSLADLDNSTRGICTPATMSVCMGSSGEISLQGILDIDVSELEEDSY